MSEQYGGLYEMILARLKTIPVLARSNGTFAHVIAKMLDDNYTLTPRDEN